MTTWLLLRGLARQSRHWGGFAVALQKRLPAGSSVRALDLPGNGALNTQASPASVDEMVDAYRSQLGATVQGESLVLLGLSLGAMVAAQWAHRHPRELAGCVMVNGSVGGLSPAWERLRPSAWLPLAAATLPLRDPRTREAAILRLCSNGAEQDMLAQWSALAMQSPTRATNAWRQLRAAIRYRLPLQSPPVPVLVLSSRADRLVDSRCSAAIAKAWGAPHLEHPAAGHELALDAPDWLARQCSAFALSRILHACHRSDAQSPSGRHVTS